MASIKLSVIDTKDYLDEESNNIQDGPQEEARSHIGSFIVSLSCISIISKEGPADLAVLYFFAAATLFLSLRQGPLHSVFIILSSSPPQYF